MESPSFDWDVKLPERGRASFGQQRPRATVVLTSSEHGEEQFKVPVAVGRALATRLEPDYEGSLPGSRAELLWLIGESSRSCGRSRIEDLVNRRDYSVKELSQKLWDDGYSSEVVEDLVARSVDCGLVNDFRYAAAFARSKVAAGWGSVKIELELKRRGIDVSEVPGWPEEFFSTEDEEERAYVLASRRRLSGKNDYAKLVRFLASRGFNMGIATSTARRILDEAEED